MGETDWEKRFIMNESEPEPLIRENEKLLRENEQLRHKLERTTGKIKELEDEVDTFRFAFVELSDKSGIL